MDDVAIHAIIEPDENQTSSGDDVKHPGDGKLDTGFRCVATPEQMEPRKR
ncbi:hypothetical protein ACFY2M_40440 [Streptomyces sp. NPDC001276]